MIFNVLVSSPYPWFFLAAIAAGAAASSLSRRIKTKHDPEKARERKGFLAAIALTLFVITLLCGLFIPGVEKAADPALFAFFGIAAVLFFLAFRFKKAAGIPFLLLVTGFIIVVVLFLQAITAFTGETEIARIKVLSARDNIIKFDFTDANGNTTNLEMPGTLLGAEVKELIFDDFFVFFGAKTAYRFIGLKSGGFYPDSEMTRELRGYELPKPQGISESLYQFVASNIGAIPGIKTAQIQITYLKVKPGVTYSIRVQHDSGVEIMQASVVTE